MNISFADVIKKALSNVELRKKKGNFSDKLLHPWQERKEEKEMEGIRITG